MYTDVQVRGLKKAVFRRLTSKLNIYKALDSKDDAKSALVELKKAFTAFQEAHDVVCAPKKKKKKAYGTWCSQAVTHPSTNQARRCLTSVIRREPVFSTWYGFNPE